MLNQDEREKAKHHKSKNWDKSSYIFKSVAMFYMANEAFFYWIINLSTYFILYMACHAKFGDFS